MFKILKAELTRKKINLFDVAMSIDSDYDTLEDKLSGKKCFTILEAQIIRDTFFSECSIDYLFQLTDRPDIRAL